MRHDRRDRYHDDDNGDDRNHEFHDGDDETCEREPVAFTL